MHDFKLRQFLRVTEVSKILNLLSPRVLPSSKCTKTHFRPGLFPGPHWGAYDVPQTKSTGRGTPLSIPHPSTPFVSRLRAYGASLHIWFGPPFRKFWIRPWVEVEVWVIGKYRLRVMVRLEFLGVSQFSHVLCTLLTEINLQHFLRTFSSKLVRRDAWNSRLGENRLPTNATMLIWLAQIKSNQNGFY